MSDDHEHCTAQPFEKSEFRTLAELRYHLFVCADGRDFCGCQANGGPALLAALRQELARRRLAAQVKVTLMQCRQQGATGPVLVVHPEGIWYAGLAAEHAAEFVERQILRGEPMAQYVMREGPRPVTSVPMHLATTG